MQQFTDKTKYNFSYHNGKVEVYPGTNRVLLVPDIKNGFQANSEKECYDEIERLGLIVEDDQEEADENETP